MSNEKDRGWQVWPEEQMIKERRMFPIFMGFPRVGNTVEQPTSLSLLLPVNAGCTQMKETAVGKREKEGVGPRDG